MAGFKGDFDLARSLATLCVGKGGDASSFAG